MSVRPEPLEIAAPTSPASLELLLLEKMDVAVLAFAEIMSDNTLLEIEGGKKVPRHTTAERIKAFELVKEYLSRRHKLLQPAQAEEEAPNIEELKRAMRDVTLETMREQHVVMLPPPKRQGRPRREHVEAKKIISAQEHGERPEDDTELRSALGNL